MKRNVFSLLAAGAMVAEGTDAAYIGTNLSLSVDYGEGDKYPRPAKREFPIRTDTSKNNDKLLSRRGVSLRQMLNYLTHTGAARHKALW